MRWNRCETCTGTLVLSTLEHLTAHKLTAISATKKPTRTTRTVTLGSATYSLTAGGRNTLNATGQQLLEEYRKLPAKVTLTPTGSRTAGATRTVTITPSKPKHHH